MITSRVNDPSIITTFTNSCIGLCTIHFAADRCSERTWCDQDSFFTCRYLFWLDDSRKDFVLVDPNDWVPVTWEPVYCSEAQDALRSDGPDNRKRRKRGIVFRDVLEDETVFHKDLAPTQIGQEYFDPEINLTAFRRVYWELGSKMAVPLVLSLGRKFPGVAQCLGDDGSLLVNMPDGSKTRISFDRSSLQEKVHLEEFLSMDGGFTLSHHPVVPELRKNKSVQLALSKFGNFALRSLPISLDSTKRECESELLLEEAFKHPHNVPREMAGLWIARAIEALEQLHSLGLVHRSIGTAFVWDGSDPMSVKIRSFQNAQFFVDEWGQHVSVLSCTVDDETENTIRFADPEQDCISRAADLEQLSLFLIDRFIPFEEVGKSLMEFDRYTHSIPYRAKPDYQSWIKVFRN